MDGVSHLPGIVTTVNEPVVWHHVVRHLALKDNRENQEMKSIMKKIVLKIRSNFLTLTAGAKREKSANIKKTLRMLFFRVWEPMEYQIFFLVFGERLSILADGRLDFKYSKRPLDPFVHRMLN